MGNDIFQSIGKFHTKARAFVELAQQKLLEEYLWGGRTEPPTDEELTAKACELLESTYRPTEDIDDADWYGNWLAQMGAKSLPIEERIHRLDLHKGAVKALMQGGLLGEFQENKYVLTEDHERSMQSFLFPAHAGDEYKQLDRDWKAAKASNDPMELARLQLKVVKWLLENEDDPAFRAGQTDEELVESWPKINQMGRAAGEVINFFDAGENPLLVSTGLLSEKEFRQYRERVDRMYVRHTEALNRINILANPLYPDADIEAPTRADEQTFTAFTQDMQKKYGGTANPYTLAHHANFLDRSIEVDRLNDQMIKLGGHNKFSFHYYDMDKKEVPIMDVMLRLRKGELLFAVDAQNPAKNTYPVAMEPGKPPIMGDEALAAAGKAGYYKKPDITGAGAYRRMPGFMQKMFFSKKERQQLDRWVKGREIARHGIPNEVKLEQVRQDLIAELTPKFEKSIQQGLRAKKAKQERQLKWREARKAYLLAQNKQMLADRYKTPENYLDMMKRDCIRDLAGAVPEMRFGDQGDWSTETQQEIQNIVGRTMFLHHLEDAKKNGSPEVRQALDQLQPEGIEKLFEDYKKTDEYKVGIEYVSRRPMISGLPLDDVATLEGSAKLLPVQMGEKQFRALELYQKNLIGTVEYLARDRRYKDKTLQFDLKAALQKSVDKHTVAKAGQTEKVIDKKGPQPPVRDGQKPPVIGGP